MKSKLATEPLRFAVIGAGRVATQLARFWVQQGLLCQGVYSRTLAHAERLAAEVGALPFAVVSQLYALVWEEQPHFLLFSVSDDALPSLVAQLPSAPCRTVLLHTTGSVPLGVFPTNRLQCGVLYPLQTFSWERAVDLTQVPYYLEASAPPAQQQMQLLVQQLGIATQVHWCNSEQRLRLHLAAVFACNFVNHLYARAYQLLQQVGLEPTALNGLMQETLQKALHQPPITAQTGPAIRHDNNTIQKHLQQLTHLPTLHKLYELLTESVQELANEQMDTQ